MDSGAEPYPDLVKFSTVVLYFLILRRGISAIGREGLNAKGRALSQIR